ncbi:gamma-glutamyl-gamma-aminobutyrate hydrolase family protein [Frigoribacterium sp. 2-23]|uniref:gamma-glutamyl-gamma-aminobutyrate hydrolase family protein n=1 Tax=Frigoribacterium sp. 2-23 TaxID=3415006 RepID=UPI003C702AF4
MTTFETRAAGFLTGAPRLAVVDVTRHRPGLADYQLYVESLVGRVSTAGADAGFAVERLPAADLGVGALLHRASSADAVVIMGGEDLAPHWYGGADGYPGEGRHQERADAGQLALVRRAVAVGTPLLGICRGHQVINVALGGTLVQHLDDDGLHLRAGAPVELLMTEHTVDVTPGSRLATVLAPRIETRSAHHQAVARLGAGLVVAATAPDGTVEAIEHEEARVTGVQWHPEDRAAARDQLPALLAALAADVATRRAGAARRRRTPVAA